MHWLAHVTEQSSQVNLVYLLLTFYHYIWLGWRSPPNELLKQACAVSPPLYVQFLKIHDKKTSWCADTAGKGSEIKRPVDVMIMLIRHLSYATAEAQYDMKLPGLNSMLPILFDEGSGRNYWSMCRSIPDKSLSINIQQTPVRCLRFGSRGHKRSKMFSHTLIPPHSALMIRWWRVETKQCRCEVHCHVFFSFLW